MVRFLRHLLVRARDWFASSGSRASMDPKQRIVLYLARYTSRTIGEISSHARVAERTVVAVLEDLESSGSVQMSTATGEPRTRIVALTAKGREQFSLQDNPRKS